jgi:hypothetical protein
MALRRSTPGLRVRFEYTTRILAAAAIAAATILVPGLGSVGRLAAVLAAYAAALVALRALPPEIRGAVSGFRARR